MRDLISLLSFLEPPKLPNSSNYLNVPAGWAKVPLLLTGHSSSLVAMVLWAVSWVLRAAVFVCLCLRNRGLGDEPQVPSSLSGALHLLTGLGLLELAVCASTRVCLLTPPGQEQSCRMSKSSLGSFQLMTSLGAGGL